MKCEKCNEREANFFWSSNINGEITQKHLCSECAREEGLMEQTDSMFDSFFSMRSPFGLLDSMWSDDFFAPFSSLATMSRPAVAQPGELKNIPAQADDSLKQKRQLLQLKNQLKKAVAAENFEQAIELRDKIRSMENRA